MSSKRRNHYDVTNTVRISHPQDVCVAVKKILSGLYPSAELACIDQSFETFTRLYAGTLPGYLGCDTWYHDAQHSLDCTLAVARVLDGHERSETRENKLGERRGLLGVIIALFHDAGYIRRTSDSAMNGAEFTLNHVRRSAEFLASFLPTIGFADQVKLTGQIVHFTGYEVELDKIRVTNPKDRMLGFMLGSADVIAQTADRCYLEKCRDYLFREFEICGLAGKPKNNGLTPMYATPKDLLQKTPDFNKKLWDERLDGYFQGCYHYMDKHFGGSNPYIDQIHGHIERVSRMNKTRRYSELKLRPKAISGVELRSMLKLKRPTVGSSELRAAA